MLDKSGKIVLSTIIIFYLIIMITLERYPDTNLSSIVTLLAVVSSIAAIIFTAVSIQNQKAQWLNDSFIKHEAEQLLAFRKMLDESGDAIHFFLSSYLVVHKKYEGDPPKEFPQIKYAELSRHFNTLLNLNGFYNSNQHIFKKYGLDRKVECIGLILESARHVPERDIEYLFHKHQNTIWTYQVEGEILEKILSFNAHAYQHFDVKPGDPEKKRINAYLKRDRLEELTRLRERTNKSLLSLVFELNQLTTFSNSQFPTSFNDSSKKFFTKK